MANPAVSQEAWTYGNGSSHKGDQAIFPRTFGGPKASLNFDECSGSQQNPFLKPLAKFFQDYHKRLNGILHSIEDPAEVVDAIVLDFDDGDSSPATQHIHTVENLRE